MIRSTAVLDQMEAKPSGFIRGMYDRDHETFCDMMIHLARTAREAEHVVAEEAHDDDDCDISNLIEALIRHAGCLSLLRLGHNILKEELDNEEP